MCVCVVEGGEQKVYPKVPFHRVVILVQPGNQAV